MRKNVFRFVVGAWLALHVYVGLRLIPALALPLAGDVIGWAYLAASAALAPAPVWLRLARLPERRAVAIAWGGYLAMGLFSLLAVLTLVRDGVLLGAWLASLAAPNAWNPLPLAQRSAWAVVGLTVALAALGVWNARRTPRVREVSIPFPGLPVALEGFTIVQLSDVHIGPTIRQGFLQRVVDRVNGLGADAVAITGDLIDGPQDRLEADLQPLARLRSRHGTFCVTGNHEYYHGADGWIAAWRRLGLTVLMNENRVLSHDGAGLMLAGVTDYSAAPFGPGHASDPERARGLGSSATGHREPDAPALRVLLAHQPRSAPAAEAAGFDLQLSGHTHGGQFWPWMLFVPLQQPQVSGLKRFGRMWLYVSRGTGYWGPPLRLGAASEITRIQLVAGRGD